MVTTAWNEKGQNDQTCPITNDPWSIGKKGANEYSVKNDNMAR